jgi:hypothetical protein
MSISSCTHPPSMLKYIFRSSYILFWRKNMSTLKIWGRTFRLKLIFTSCRSFLRIFWFSSLFVFVSNTCILNNLESISIWYQIKVDSIAFQLNTRYIHFVAPNVSDVKNLLLPLPEMKKKPFLSLKSLDKTYFVLNCDLFLY